MNKFLFFLIVFFSSFINVFAQEESFVRITGGPVFYDEFNQNFLDTKKWNVWQEQYDEKKYFSYKTNVNGYTIFTTMHCFKENNYYGLISPVIGRGLTDVSLVAEVETFNETKDLQAIVHFCNCCSEFSDFKRDDFWCEVDVHKNQTFYFNRVVIDKFKNFANRIRKAYYPANNPTSSNKYFIKITHSIPSYKISGYIKPNEENRKYDFIGSTINPYPLSQARVELKTFTPKCSNNAVLASPLKVATFRNVRMYKNPKNHPLFIRVINSKGIGVKDYIVKSSAGNKNVSAKTDDDGYAKLDLSKLKSEDYPISNYNIQVFKAGLSLVSIFNQDFKTVSIKEGIYPGDFWQLFCRNCN